MSELVAESWNCYLRQLQLHPLRTKAITSGVLVGCGDAVAQKISGIKKLQLRRLLLIMVLLEQLTASPWNNMIFMIYYGLVVEENMSSRISGTSRRLLYHCGFQTSLLASRKAHSYGRKFYSCSRSIAEQCHFFRWADGLTESPGDNDRE